MPKPPETYRLFFALWPAPELASQLETAVAKPLLGCDGKRVPSHNYHITLAFYGTANADALNCLRETAGTLHGQAFALRLEQLGYWPRPRVCWLAPTELPEPLSRLQAELSQRLVDSCAYQAENRPYRPHLTLSRKSKQAPDQLAIAPICWEVDRFVLVRSMTRPSGVEYTVLQQWPLEHA